MANSFYRKFCVEDEISDRREDRPTKQTKKENVDVSLFGTLMPGC
jgi:hypothetical protein